MWLWVVGYGLLVLLNVNAQSNDLTIYLSERPYHNK